MAARVAILAQDLIWAERLASAVRSAGGEPVGVRSSGDLPGSLAGAALAIVDLTARAYDPLAAIEAASTAGVRVIAVGQHDDHELRKRALAVGAERVYAYRKLFEDGPATIAGLLARGETAAPRA